MSSGLYSHTTRGIGTVLTAAIYNADHNNHITNANPSQHGGYSDSVAEMRTMVNPGGVGSEVLSTDLAGELARLRYTINRIAGTTHWYEAPVTSLALIGGGIPLTLAFAATPLTIRRTENDITAREILSLGSGSGAGNKFALQMVGTGSNAAAELRLLLASTELIRFSATLLTHFIAHEFRSYTDFVEMTAPATPAANTARLYAKDISGLTRLCYKDPAGTEFTISNPTKPSQAYHELTAYTVVETEIPNDDSVPTNSEGTSILSAAIELALANSKVRVKFSAMVSVSVAANTVIAAIFRGSTCIGARAISASAVSTQYLIELEVQDTPASVGPHTYTVRLGLASIAASRQAHINGLSASGRVLGGSSRATLMVEEQLI